MTLGPYYERNALGVVKGPTQITLSPYYARNMHTGSKGTRPDKTKPMLCKEYAFG